MPSPLPEVIVTERLTLARREDVVAPAADFVIRTTADDLTIGDAGLAPLGEGDWSVDLRVAEPWRQQGFGREAGRALLGLAFSELGAARVVVAFDRDNEAAQALAERLGLNGQGIQEGRRRYMAWRPPGATPPRRGPGR